MSGISWVKDSVWQQLQLPGRLLVLKREKKIQEIQKNHTPEPSSERTSWKETEGSTRCLRADFKMLCPKICNVKR